MLIGTKNWVAQNDKMPGNARFRVQGTVTVGHPGIVPTLSQCAVQDKSHALALEITQHTLEGFFTQSIVDKDVCFEMAGSHDSIREVDIFHEGKLITSITEICETN